MQDDRVGTIPKRSRTKQFDESRGDEGSKDDLLRCAFYRPREVELETVPFGLRRGTCIGDSLQEMDIRFGGELEASDVLEGEEGGESRVVLDDRVVVVERL